MSPHRVCGALRAPTAPSRLAVRPCTCPAATMRVAWGARDGGASRPWPLGWPARRPRAARARGRARGALPARALERPRGTTRRPPARASFAGKARPSACVRLLAAAAAAPAGPVHWAPMATGSAACARGAASLDLDSWRDVCPVDQTHTIQPAPQGGRIKLDGMHGGARARRRRCLVRPAGHPSHAPSPATPRLSLAAPPPLAATPRPPLSRDHTSHARTHLRTIWPVLLL